MSKKNFEAQTRKRKIVLEALIAGPMRWTKLIDETAHQTGSHHISKHALRCLINEGRVEKVPEGYRITERGLKFLELSTNRREIR